MASPAVDLPTPRQDPPAPAGGTDDLLSQMAGEEIDRLLADAGVERNEAAPQVPSGPPATPVPAPAVPPVAAATSGSASPLSTSSVSAPQAGAGATTIAKELDQVFDQQLRSATAGVGPAPAKEPPAGDVSADGVTDLLGRLEAGERPPSPPDVPTARPTSDVAPAAPEAPAPAVPAAAVREPAGPTTVVPALPAAVRSGSGTARVSAAARSAVARLVVGLLDPFPDGARDAVGKVAIVTAVNAVAVLIYVWFFRR